MREAGDVFNVEGDEELSHAVFLVLADEPAQYASEVQL